MTTAQTNLFDSKAVRDEAIDRVDRHAHRRFMDLAYRAGRHLCKRSCEFTSADLRDLLARHYPDVKTHDDRALGAVMRQLQREGWIEATDRVQSSGRVRNHHRPLRVWWVVQRKVQHEPRQ
jgi:hypothetical protein